MAGQNDGVTAVGGLDGSGNGSVRIAGPGSIARIVKENRIRLGMSQERLADCANVSVRSIKQIESGDGNPRFDTLLAVLDVMGLDVFSMRNGEDGRRPSGGGDGRDGGLDLSGTTIVIGGRRANIDLMAAATRLTAGTDPLCVYTSDTEAKRRCWEAGILANVPPDDDGQFDPFHPEHGPATYYVSVLGGLMLDLLRLSNGAYSALMGTVDNLMHKLAERHHGEWDSGITLPEFVAAMERYGAECMKEAETAKPVGPYREKAKSLRELGAMASMLTGLMRVIYYSDPMVADIIVNGPGDFRTPTVAVQTLGDLCVPAAPETWTAGERLHVISRAAYAACLMRTLQRRDGDPLLVIDHADQLLLSRTMATAYELNYTSPRPENTRVMAVFTKPEAAAQAVRNGLGLRPNPTSSVYIGQPQNEKALEETATLLSDAYGYGCMQDPDHVDTMKRDLRRRIEELGRNEYLHATFRSGREPRIDRIRIDD